MKRERSIKLAGAIFMAIVLALLLPCLINAGSLEPSDSPGPTMHTLDELYNKPVWKMFDKIFVDWSANPRFAVCDNGTTDRTYDDMVLDKETGLVWIRDHSLSFPSPPTYTLDWAIRICNDGMPGINHGGWRLPTFQELQSLVDWNNYNPALPSGHPFINVQWQWIGGEYPPSYWTTTPHTTCSVPNGMSIVWFGNGGTSCAGRDERFHVWCVRGGQGATADLLYWIK
jgi:hypothetical protein